MTSSSLGFALILVAVTPSLPRAPASPVRGRHGECVAVVNGLAVQRKPKRVRELCRDRSDPELATLGGAQVVFVPAGSAGS
jgi:hypothetical protein